MLFLKPLNTVYGALEPEANYGTLFGGHAHAREIGWCWITDHYRRETQRLLDHLAREDGIQVTLEDLSFGIMGGTVFCRAFLEKYSARAVLAYSNDELRLSVYSAAFGIPLLDNRVYRNPHNIYYGDSEDVLTQSHVDLVIARGGDVLHPVRVLLHDVGRMIGFPTMFFSGSCDVRNCDAPSVAYQRSEVSLSLQSRSSRHFSIVPGQRTC